MPGLGTSFGRGGATTAQQDLQNADAILIMGSSMAENHPVGFQWVLRARERGATIIHVDPRFSRTSAMADIWLPLRAGSDMVFLGALVNYVIANGLAFFDYVIPYTNAATIIGDEFRDTEDLNGLFSGWDSSREEYSNNSWAYAGSRSAADAAGRDEPRARSVAAASALRLPDSVATLFALHAGDGRGGLRRPGRLVRPCR